MKKSYFYSEFIAMIMCRRVGLNCIDINNIYDVLVMLSQALLSNKRVATESPSNNEDKS